MRTCRIPRRTKQEQVLERKKALWRSGICTSESTPPATRQNFTPLFRGLRVRNELTHLKRVLAFAQLQGFEIHDAILVGKNNVRITLSTPRERVMSKQSK